MRVSGHAEGWEKQRNRKQKTEIETETETETEIEAGIETEIEIEIETEIWSLNYVTAPQLPDGGESGLSTRASCGMRE